MFLNFISFFLVALAIRGLRGNGKPTETYSRLNLETEVEQTENCEKFNRLNIFLFKLRVEKTVVQTNCSEVFVYNYICAVYSISCMYLKIFFFLNISEIAVKERKNGRKRWKGACGREDNGSCSS